MLFPYTRAGWRGPHLFVPLEGDPLEFGPPSAQPVRHLVPQKGRVAQVFVDRVGGHLGDVLCSLGLDVECDQGICHQVMDRLKSLLPDKVLAIIEESVVQSLICEPSERHILSQSSQDPSGSI